MLKSEILREIGALSRSIHSINDAALRTYGLQRGQFPFLTRICESPGITPTQLAAALRMDKTTTTKAEPRLSRGSGSLATRRSQLASAPP